MRGGSIYQRHLRSCPRDERGRLRSHKCRGPWAYWLLVGQDRDGRRRQVSKSGFSTKREAERALKELLAREHAEIAEVHRLTVGTYLHQWLEGKRSLRDTTRGGYASNIRLYLDPYLGRILLAELRPHHLDPMYSDLLSGTHDRIRAVATVHRVHATLRSALNSAVKRRLIPWNPALHVELPAPSRPATGVWTPEQLGHFLDSIADHRLYALFHLVALAGLRRGEALGLRWADLDLDTATIRVSQQLLASSGGLHFGAPKTKSGVRSVALDAETVQVLRAHRAQQRSERARWGDLWLDRQLVFTREDGEVMHPDNVTHMFQKLVARAELPRIRLHDLRHTSASLALAAGVPIKVVSSRLGHSTTAITSDLYTHVVPVVARDAADRIAAAVPRRSRRPPSYASPTHDLDSASGEDAK